MTMEICRECWSYIEHGGNVELCSDCARTCYTRSLGAWLLSNGGVA
jgi:hypothetical protein